MIRRIIIFVFFSCFSNVCFIHAQAVADTLYPETFLQIIKEYHPAVKNAMLNTFDYNAANLRKARGMFDPKATFDLENKFFSGKNYFFRYEAAIKQPTITGIDLYAKYNFANGFYLGNEYTVPPSGLYSIGAEIPLMQNLLYDQRRFHLQSAKLLHQNSDVFFNDQLIEILSRLFAKYWDYVEKENIWRVYQQITYISYQRYLNVLKAVATGEFAQIDTLDAGNQYNYFLLQTQKAQIEYMNARLDLLADLIGFTDTLFVAPVFDWLPDIPISTDSNLWQNIPELKIYALKLDLLNFEKKYKQEMIKPKINIRYNFLLQPFANQYAYPFDMNNYKWGIEFSYPLLLRKERADLKITKIKIDQTRNEYFYKQLQWQNKFRRYTGNYYAYRQQFRQMTELANRYKLMLDAEIAKFQAGEGNLFYVNTREIYYAENKIKAYQSGSKYFYYKTLLQILQEYSKP